jgi:transcription elongation factor Elf1
MLSCGACGGELHVRRADAYRDVDVAIAWMFACYANDEPEAQELAQWPGLLRLLKRS